MIPVRFTGLPACVVFSVDLSYLTSLGTSPVVVRLLPVPHGLPGVDNYKKFKIAVNKLYGRLAEDRRLWFGGLFR